MFDGKSVLIVEDEAMLAADLAAAVEDLEGRVIGPVASVEAALALLNSETVAAAVLDVHLVDRDVTPVGLQLIESGVPFVVITGDEMPAAVGRSLGDPIVLRKPLNSAVVLACLLNEMRDAGHQILLT